MAGTLAELNLHPEAKAFMESTMSLWEGLGESKSIEKLRSTLDAVSKAGLVGVVNDYEGTRQERFVDSTEVEGGIPVYVYKPKSVDNEDEVPILVYFHGGGNIMGSRDLVDDTCKLLSSLADCIVVNVEYRLAPEHKFPAMINDAYAAVRWVLDNRSLVGGTSKSKVGVSGDSAGGQIAAAVSHQVPGVDFQILIYPWLNVGGENNLPSHEEFKNGPLSMDGLTQWILSLLVEKKEDLLDPRLCIFRNEKYDHLPTTLCIVAEFDPLRDESYEYSKRLTAAGVDSEVFLAKGAIHGYFTAPGAFAQLCGQSYAKAVGFINKIRKQQ